MSAPPLVDPPAMPTMVSRLPKFGSRPKSQTVPTIAANLSTAATSTRLTNGFYHHPGPAGVNGTLATPSTAPLNGFIRVPSSMQWRKENGTIDDGGANREIEWRRGKSGNVGQNHSGIHQYYYQSDAKKPTTSIAGKGRGLGQSMTSALPSPQSRPRTLPVPKSGSHSSKLSQLVSGLPNGTKHTLNGFSGSNPRTRANSSLRQPQSYVRPGGPRPGSGPGSRSGSPLQKKAPASRSYSSDSLGSAPPVQLTESDRFRSRSLSQVRRQPSPTLTPSTTSSSSSLAHSPTVTRSYSNSRAGPPRSSLLKSPVSSQTSEGAGRGVNIQRSAASGRSGISIHSLLPPSALKKSLLPNLSVASKPGGISYKLSRPSVTKQSRPLRVNQATVSPGNTKVKQELNGRRNSVEIPPTTENSPENMTEAPETEGLSAEPVSLGEVSIVGETLEDMSLSSNSSLDRNDTSQEYMDDFDNLGNGGMGIMLFSSKNDEDDSGLDQSCARFDDDRTAINGDTKTTELCFLDDGVDWSGVRLCGDQGEHQLSRHSHRRRSTQPDYHDQGGSSLDLSPSDSCGSGGTYMWDEEGLEPLGDAATTASIHTNSNTTHHIGSFDSDLNSIDILNNLDSCDLADDDLMLDVDFPEDVSLHSDVDGLPHMAQWRRRQLCWGTQDVHNDNESEFQCYRLTEDPGNKRTDATREGDLILQLCPPSSACLSPSTPSLGLDVEELAEDCSAVKSQLEYLQRLLLQEDDVDDDTLTTDTLSPEANNSSHSSDSQVQALLQEVQQLREELKSRDRTIAQLTQQLTVPNLTTRCCCQDTTGRMDQHTQTSVTESQSVASQTPWREHASQILHSSNQEDQEPLTDRIQAPPPPNPCSICPETPADRLLCCPNTTSTHGGEDDGKPQRKEEQRGESRGTYSRSLLPPQPTKLRLFLPHTFNTPKTRMLRQPPCDPDNRSSSSGSSTSGVKFKTLASSRLPKPKTLTS
ncbi:serine-rich coiled-coil domain-containing protein 2-like isoform X2 [Parambassis ranga]|uniref:Serine-rich coiled-coil domain-containing protein 2-like isoform X2 n=1 Tax=Parambassis ranga TaxID=210632 RepID=A0A6P7K8V5_9TELE|nr:serine-rich coiled-coil domain-containing protein 2-like isoform X2 [Parambassis ranga]